MVVQLLTSVVLEAKAVYELKLGEALCAKYTRQINK